MLMDRLGRTSFTIATPIANTRRQRDKELPQNATQNFAYNNYHNNETIEDLPTVMLFSHHMKKRKNECIVNKNSATFWTAEKVK